jgi:hypothetical protein
VARLCLDTAIQADFFLFEPHSDFFSFESQYVDIFKRRHFFLDVLLQETFCYGDVMYQSRYVWRLFVAETFCVEMFCKFALPILY